MPLQRSKDFRQSLVDNTVRVATLVQAPSDPRPSPTVLRFTSVVSACAIYRINATTLCAVAAVLRI